YTNELLRQHQLDLPTAHLLSEGDTLPACNFPLVLKPLRGRGSQGVQLIEDTIQLEAAIEKFFSSRSYGHKVVLETYLSGKEITTTVMPPGTYRINDKKVVHEKHWCLHPVERINHVNGITPYSGQVPVSANSHLMPMEVLKLPAMQRIIQQCAYAAERIDARAPIRIDSRADTAGTYRLFDVNLKPNMTGASRPHRAGQNSLSAIAAAALNWNYTDFIWNILQQRWLMK
ncbi:MAG: carboxylate--amine ligase, partial [Bacteroidota bacterium]